MSKKGLYLKINILVIGLAFVFALMRTEAFAGVRPVMDGHMLYLAPVFAAGFALVHGAKMMRFYLLLMGEKIHYLRFIKVYMKITFVNLALPLKLGEIFRIYCYANEVGNAKIGFLSVIVDRFFDISALLVVLIPYDLVVNREISPVTFMLVLFAAVVLFLYRIFLPTYTYLNRYLITRTASRKTVRLLYGLESGRQWYDYIRNLLEGRSSLVFICSCVGWIAEFGVLKCIQQMLLESFTIRGFVEYINAIFGLGDATLLNIYITVSCIILAVLTFSIYGISFSRRRRVHSC